MIPARARKASLASLELGKAAATSGSRTMTALPAAYREANLLGEPRRKSYSGRISSTSTRSAAPRLLGDFFITSSLMDRRRRSPPPRTILCAWRHLPQPFADPIRTPTPAPIILASRRSESPLNARHFRPSASYRLNLQDNSCVTMGCPLDPALSCILRQRKCQA